MFPHRDLEISFKMMHQAGQGPGQPPAIPQLSGPVCSADVAVHSLAGLPVLQFEPVQMYGRSDQPGAGAASSGAPAKSAPVWNRVDSALEDTSHRHGMVMVYVAVDWLITGLSQFFPHEYIFTDDSLGSVRSMMSSLTRNKAEVLHYSRHYLVAMSILLLLTILFTLGFIGYALFSCVSICCRKCRRSRKSTGFYGASVNKSASLVEVRADGRWDACRRRSFTGLLAVLVIVLVMCVVCTYLSNEHMHGAAVELPERAKLCVDALSLYRDENDRLVRKLLVQDYDHFNDTVVTALDGTAASVVQALMQCTRASALNGLGQLEHEARQAEAELNALDGEIAGLETDLELLGNLLARYNKSAAAELARCGTGTLDQTERDLCAEVAAQLSSVWRDLPPAAVSQMGELDLTPVKADLMRIIQYNVPGQLADARRRFEQLQARIEAEIHERKREVYPFLSELSSALSERADQTSDKLAQMDMSIAYKAIDDHTDDFIAVEQYRWVVFLVLPAPLAVLAALLCLGLAYGCCGKRPSYYEDGDCCLRSTASPIFTVVITIGVLTAILYAILICVLFTIGANVFWLGCDPLERPMYRNDMISFAERLKRAPMWREIADKEALDYIESTNITEIIEGCNRNETFYSMLHLDEKLRFTNITSLQVQATARLEQFLDDIDRKLLIEINDIDLGQLIDSEVEQRLKTLQSYGVRRIDDEFIQSLVQRAQKLNITQYTIPARMAMERKNVLTQLEGLERTQVAPVRTRILHIADSLTELNKLNLTETIGVRLADLKHAQQLLRANVTHLIRELISAAGTHGTAYIEQYASHVKVAAQRKLSSCEPLTRVGRLAKQSTCVQIVSAWNAYWGSLCVALLLCMPALVLAACLRPLYRNTEPYGTGALHFGANGVATTSGGNRRLSAFMTDVYDQNNTYSRLERLPVSTSAGTGRRRVGVPSPPAAPYHQSHTTGRRPVHSPQPMPPPMAATLNGRTRRAAAGSAADCRSPPPSYHSAATTAARDATLRGRHGGTAHSSQSSQFYGPQW